MPYSKRDQLIMCAIKWVLAPLDVETLLSLRNHIPAQRYLRNEGVAQMDGNCGRQLTLLSISVAGSVFCPRVGFSFSISNTESVLLPYWTLL